MGCPLPVSSDLLNLLSDHPEGQIAVQYLGVARSLFRKDHRSVRVTWDHPSLILTSSFLPDGMPFAKMEACVLDRTADVWCSARFLSSLHISNSHPGIIHQTLFLFVFPQATYNQNEAPGPALLGRYLERKWTFLHCWVVPVLTPAILLWRSKQDSDLLFSSGLLFCHDAICICGISLASKKADKCDKTSA